MPWWMSGVLYQVYPRSFADSDGDGIGDLRGIVGHFNHFTELGIDGIWISPIYPSPMIDFGYDITDHCNVDPIFGSLADFDRLVEVAHAKGLKIVLDYVPSHTSDRHPWFVEAGSSREASRRDWYIWADPARDGGPPNNWLSEFGGPAWTLDTATGQYYYHAHLSRQPDLNWRNPDVRKAMLDVLRFWFERGVDGFRVDAVDQLAKDPALKDNPANPEWREGLPPKDRWLRTGQRDRDELHAFTREMRVVADEYGGRLLAAEAYQPIPRMMAYYGTDLAGFHMPYNFHLIMAPWNARSVAGLVEEYEAALPQGAWPNWVLGNHDKSRVASRIGPQQARVAAMLQLTLRGTPTIYQGEELGMTDVPIPPERVRDPFELNSPGFGLGRDPVRTPIAWETGPAAGFTTGEPWLPVDDRPAMAVANQERDDSSMLSLYRALLKLRRLEPALHAGSYGTVEVGDDLFVYARAHGDRRFVVALNFSARAVAIPRFGETVLSTSATTSDSVTHLAPNEGRIMVAPE